MAVTVTHPSECRTEIRWTRVDDRHGHLARTVEPGHLLRVVTPGTEPHGSPADITDPLPVCAPCYTALTPLSTPPAAAAE